MKCLLLLASLVLRTTLQSNPELREYCYNEEFQANCHEEDEVVVVRSALYGRMRRGKCLRGDYENHGGCKQNVLRQTDRLCSGRKNCSLKVNEYTFKDNLCSSNSRPYFEVIYECLKVITAPSADCRRHKQVLVKNRQHGYLSSHVTQRYHYGTSTCPWRIELSRWQRINFTLIDFSMPMFEYRSSPHVNRSECNHRFGVITERSATLRTTKICGGDKREVPILMTRTHAVEVRIVSEEESDFRDFHFLIRFDAIGCPDPVPPKNGWFLRESDGVTLYCNHSSVEWRMICDDETNKWVGHYENCSSEEAKRIILKLGKVGIPHTVSVVVIVTLSIIGVIIIVLISLLCLEWFRGGRRKTQRDSIQVTQDQPIEQHRPRDTHESSGKATPIPPTSQASVSVITSQRTSSTREEIKPPGILRNAHNYQQQHYNYPPPDPMLFNSSSEEAEEDKYNKMSASSKSAVSNDYVREMWPMVPPPKLSGVEECARPDSRTEVARCSLFQYGDSVTLNSSAAQASSGLHMCRTLQPRGAQLVEVDDDTHIYETPKYLRREKAATMRLQSKGGTSKTLSFYAPTCSVSGLQKTGNILEQQESRSARTLPRHVVAVPVGVKL